MRSEREKITGKVAAATLRLNIGRYELPPDEDTCYLLLVSEGSVTLEYEGGNVLVNPGSAVLLGPGGCSFAQTGSAVPQIVGCHFPLGMLHDLKNTAGRDFGRLFAPGERTVLYAPVQWQSRIRTLLEMMASASTEQDYPGPLYLLLILHYVEQECIAESSAVARPHNETWRWSGCRCGTVPWCRGHGARSWAVRWPARGCQQWHSAHGRWPCAHWGLPDLPAPPG